MASILDQFNKPIVTKGLLSPNYTGTFEDWRASGSTDFPSIAPSQQEDTVAQKVTDITSQDSALMKVAQTEGLKLANKRGLLNSSLAAGTSQDAMMRYAVPIASQDAAQAFNKNQAARQFEYNMAQQGNQQDFLSGQAVLDRDLAREEMALRERMQGADIASREKLTFAQIESSEGIAAAQRALDLELQKNAISSQEAMQIKDIASREGMAAADRALQQSLADQRASLERELLAANLSAQEAMQIRDIASREGIARAQMALQEVLTTRQIESNESISKAEISSREKISLADIASQEGIARAQMALQERLQTAQIDANTEAQIRQYAFQGDMAAADRALQTALQQSEQAFQERVTTAQITSAEKQQLLDIAYREGTAAADRALQETLQQKDIEFRTEISQMELEANALENQLSRESQEALMGLQINSQERIAAGNLLYNMETLYNTSVSNIYANTDMDAEGREAALTSAKNLRDYQLNLVQQMYDVALDWGQPGVGTYNTAQATQLINDIYQADWGRMPTTGEIDFWAPLIVSGDYTTDDIRAAIVTEKSKGANTLSQATQTVNDVYQSDFGRAPSTYELDLWTPLIQSGQYTVDDIKAAIIREKAAGG